MKILVLTGSPHENGISAALADAFCLGAEDAGHMITRFDTAKMNISPCMGCFKCHSGNDSCVQNDDMNLILPHLITADAIALVSPLYYFSLTAQLKTAVDRFFPVNEKLKTLPIKAVLLATCGNPNEWISEGLKSSFSVMCRHLNLENRGSIISYGCRDVASLESGGYVEAATSLGRSL